MGVSVVGTIASGSCSYPNILLFPQDNEEDLGSECITPQHPPETVLVKEEWGELSVVIMQPIGVDMINRQWDIFGKQPGSVR